MNEAETWLWFSELARNFALIIASGTGAIVAILGLSAWKRQKIWERDERLASNILEAVYGFREALSRFRRENMSRAEKELISRQEKQFDNFFEAAMAGMNPYYQSRLDGVIAAGSKLRIATGEAQFFWRDPFPSVYSDILQEEFEIRSFLSEYYGGEIMGEVRTLEDLNEFARRSEILIAGTVGASHKEVLLNERIAEVQLHLRAHVGKST
jgi:hypothetical protein